MVVAAATMRATPRTLARTAYKGCMHPLFHGVLYVVFTVILRNFVSYASWSLLSPASSSDRRSRVLWRRIECGSAPASASVAMRARGRSIFLRVLKHEFACLIGTPGSVPA